MASLLGVVVDLRRRRWRPPGIRPLVHSQGGDSVFHVEAERRRASGCRTDAGASNPRDAWWGAVTNAVPDGSPRRCNAFRRLRSVRALRHVTIVRNRTDSKTLHWISTIIGDPRLIRRVSQSKGTLTLPTDSENQNLTKKRKQNCMTMTGHGERTVESARPVARFWSASWGIHNWRLHDRFAVGHVIPAGVTHPKTVVNGAERWWPCFPKTVKGGSWCLAATGDFKCTDYRG